MLRLESAFKYLNVPPFFQLERRTYVFNGSLYWKQIKKRMLYCFSDRIFKIIQSQNIKIFFFFSILICELFALFTVRILFSAIYYSIDIESVKYRLEKKKYTFKMY